MAGAGSQERGDSGTARNVFVLIPGSPMRKLIVPAATVAILLLVIVAVAAPRGKWVEARSPNFIVVSNAGEGQARKVAVQFEQIRSLFRDSLPYVKGTASP